MSQGEISGIKVEYIEWIIEIIREKYSIVKQGTKYLETAEKKFDLTALANTRDFLSHIETAFRKDISNKEREKNIDQSEEHLRRALVESHQIALESRLDSFLNNYEKYQEKKLPNEKKYGIEDITDHSRIRKDIRYIETLLNQGRKKKGTNIWNAEWEEGVEDFIKGYDLTVALQEQLRGYEEKYFANEYNYKKDLSNKILTVVLALLGIFASLVIALLFSDTGTYLIKYFLEKK